MEQLLFTINNLKSQTLSLKSDTLNLETTQQRHQHLLNVALYVQEKNDLEFNELAYKCVSDEYQHTDLLHLLSNIDDIKTQINDLKLSIINLETVIFLAEIVR